ncbi:MAG: STAS domain-containing protein [Gammaproteobacteria bacterium]|nr:STAS domain-containing protein [Gammaproteobacteria bacterium]
MTTVTKIIPTETGFSVQGAVSFDNVLALRLQGEKLLATREAAVIDLSEMKDQDASPLSLILCWERVARKKNCVLNVTHKSISLQRMGKMFGL